MIGIRNIGKLSYLHCYGICHHCSSLRVCKKHPALALCQSKRFHLLVELQAIGFLGIRPRRVSSSLNLYRIDKVVVHSIARYPEIGVQVVLLACNRKSILNINIYAWNTSVVGMPIGIYGVYASKRNPYIPVDGILYLYSLAVAWNNIVQSEFGKYHMVVAVLACSLLQFQISVASAKFNCRRCIFGSCFQWQLSICRAEAAYKFPRAVVVAGVEVKLFGVVIAHCARHIVEFHYLHGAVKCNGYIGHHRRIV